MNSKVSVIMGIYNCQETLSEAIESIISQTYRDWELIMCDDCSSDDTYFIAKKYADEYPQKIVLLKNEINMKLAYSLNHCLQYVTGYYVARMDGDDISAPNRFEKQVLYLQSHPEVQLVGTAMQWFNDEYGKSKVLYKPEHPDKWSLSSFVPFQHATIMTYKSVYDALGGYTVSEQTARCEDYDLWFRFFAEGFAGDNLQENLYFVREDRHAIERRTFKARWASFQVSKKGYKLLAYPRAWLVKEFFITLGKSFVPKKMMYFYRIIQLKYTEIGR